MKQLFKCQYTGKVFENELDCKEHEYIHGNEHQQFVELVYKFVDRIEEKFAVNVNRETLNIYDKLENYYNDRMIHRRRLGFLFDINGEQHEYFRQSDTVGDGRWEWHMVTLVDMVNDFETEFILPTFKFFKGRLGIHSGYGKLNYTLGKRNLEDILALLNGKKIKITILE